MGSAAPGARGRTRAASLVFCFSVLLAGSAFGLRFMEHLDRGVVALSRTNGDVFISWRWLGDDPDELASTFTGSVGPKNQSS